MMITENDNLNKYGVRDGKSYVARVGFDKNGDTCVRWYKLTGHRGASVASAYYSFNKKSLHGVDIVVIQ